jgi:SH3-like domain-containing protein
MKWKVVFAVLFLGALAWSRPGHAEKVKTNQSTKLYSRAGEQSPVVLKLQAGQSMTILAKDGRWIKVRVSGRTGWIPRSKVDLPNDDEELARNTRRRPFVDGRGTKRGFGGEGGPDDRIGADATGAGDEPASRSGKAAKGDDDDQPKSRSRKTADDDDDDKPSTRTGKQASEDDGDEPAKDSEDGDDGKEPVRPMAHVAKSTPIYNDPDSKSDESFTAQPKTALYIVEEKGKWTFVENEEGDAGYVLTSKLDVDRSTAGGPRTRAIDLRGRLGVAVVRQSVSTPGGMLAPPDNYTASSSSFTIALGASVLYPYSKRYWIGGEFALDYDKAVPGIGYMGKSTGFTYYNLNLRAVGAYDLQKPSGMMVLARLGLHYDSFQVSASRIDDFTDNPAKIPNQIIAAPSLGGALAIPRLTKDIGMKLSLDTVLFGASVSQTKNLEDGTGPSAKAVYLGSSFTYRWRPKMDLQGTLDLAYTSLSFSGPPPMTSVRGHTGTGTPSGSDFNVTLAFGIAYAL